jgi:hypothetical protein
MGVVYDEEKMISLLKGFLLERAHVRVGYSFIFVTAKPQWPPICLTDQQLFRLLFPIS